MKAGILITVRLGSTRLPRKALLEVDGNPILLYLIERLKRWNRVPIFICTTTLMEDLALCKLAEQMSIHFFQGSEENIPLRHYQCMESHGLDFAVNIDGDDIFCAVDYVKKILVHYDDNKEIDVIKTSGLPFGMNAMGYKKTAIKKVVETTASGKVDTGWGELIQNGELFKIDTIEALDCDRGDFRLTLDYLDDFKVFSQIIMLLRDTIFEVNQTELVSVLHAHPEITEINRHLNEVYWENYQSHKESEGR